jgi:hypothetical protein
MLNRRSKSMPYCQQNRAKDFAGKAVLDVSPADPETFDLFRKDITNRMLAATRGAVLAGTLYMSDKFNECLEYLNSKSNRKLSDKIAQIWYSLTQDLENESIGRY